MVWITTEDVLDAKERLSMAKSKKWTRRGFLKGAGLAGVSLSMPAFIPSACQGKDSRVAPSERIVLGAIGVGGRGYYDLTAILQEKDVQVVAVCDVRKSMRERAKSTVDAHYGNQDCVEHADFRDLLDREDIEGIITAPGDRWHTPISVMAMRAGKDVYSEKPSTLTIAQGRILSDVARDHARIFQTGTQRRSEALFVLADELARLGRLGEVHTVYAHTLPFAMHRHWLPEAPLPAKEDLDWEMWLGPAPWRPYHPDYLNGCGAWLDFFDFGTGVAGWCSHTICQCQGVLGYDLDSGTEYHYPGNSNADSFRVSYAHGADLVLSVGSSKWKGSCGVRYEGTEGWVSMADGYHSPEVSSPSLLSDRRRLVQEYMERTRRPMNHLRDFLDCMRSRRQATTHAEVAHRSMTTCHAINISMLLQRDLTWDSSKEEFVHDEEANRMRSRAMREPWHM